MSNTSPRSVQQYFEKAAWVTTGSAYSDQTVSGSIVQLSRVHDFSWTIQYNLVEDEYLNGGTESYLTAATEPSFNIRWYHTVGDNERYLGLMDLLAPSGTLGFNLNQEKNIYLSVENTQVDAIGASGAAQSKTIIGLAQCLMTQYQIGVSVGNLIESQASFASLTSYVYSGSVGNQVPTVSAQDGSQYTGLFVLPAATSQYGPLDWTSNTSPVSAIAARDMIMIFPGGDPFGITLTGFQSCYLQGFQCSISIDRHELKPLGYVFPPKRGILYPLKVDLTTDAVVSSYQADQLQRLSCLATGQSVYVVVKQPCSNEVLFGLYFDNLQIDSQAFVTTIGRNDVVSIKWRGLISSPNQPFFNPFPAYLVNSSLSGAPPWGIGW